MKKTVIDEEYLASVSPFFRGKAGKLLAYLVLKILGIDKVNALYSRNCHKQGPEFTTLILKDIGVSYEIINPERLKTLPHGAFITVSNHPLGSIDGIMLIDVFAKYRPDFKVMVNGILTHIEAMDENFIAVKPATGNKNNSTSATSINGIRESLDRLRNKHPLGFFPAGAISMLDPKTGEIEDRDWQSSIVRLIKGAKVPIYPVYFDGLNSNFFYQLGRLSWLLRSMRIPHEVFNKQGTKFRVVIGNPITPEEQKLHKDVNALGKLLKTRTYDLKKDL
ncbi:MAG: lysophospholipid acyltransferase family protein [Bacteroidales bacterium]